MIRILVGLSAACVIGICAENAKAQYYVPSFVPIYGPQYTVPGPIIYYSVPRYDSWYGYYPRRNRTTIYSFGGPIYGGNVYNIYGYPRVQVQRVPVTTERSRPSGVHPSQYIGNPHASQYMGNPHASQYFPQ